MCIENITIFSPTLEQHYEDVNCVLERLGIANLEVNVFKCAFACEKVIVLGFKVFKDHMNPEFAKIQGINDLQPLKTYLGLIFFLECSTFT